MKLTDNGDPVFTEKDRAEFLAGVHCTLYRKLGAHRSFLDGKDGFLFAVWAPSAAEVSVTGDFNAWNQNAHPLSRRMDGSGVWEGFVPGAVEGQRYRFVIRSKYLDHRVEKTDPFAFACTMDRGGASVLAGGMYEWTEKDGAAVRGERNSLGGPVSIYKIHPASWGMAGGAGSRFRDLGESLSEYLAENGFTHVDFSPLCPQPDPCPDSPGCTAFFSPASAYGSPAEFAAMISLFHERGLGVFLDWSGTRFRSDLSGLSLFDGSRLYESAYASSGFRDEWEERRFDLGTPEVRSFLLSSAHFWLDVFHADGIVVPDLRDILHPDGGTPGALSEDPEAVRFVRVLTGTISRRFPHCRIIAGRNGGRPMISRPEYIGGLGFDLSSHDAWTEVTSSFFFMEPGHRKYRDHIPGGTIEGGIPEGALLSVSPAGSDHPTVYSRMPGGEREKLANMRLLLGYMYGFPGKKLIPAGLEIAERVREAFWREPDRSLLRMESHRRFLSWVRELNRLYGSEPALHRFDTASDGFELLDLQGDANIAGFFRKSGRDPDTILVLCNFSDRTFRNYLLSLPRIGSWVEIASSDNEIYGGGGGVNPGVLISEPGFNPPDAARLTLTVPALSVLYLRSIQ